MNLLKRSRTGLAAALCLGSAVLAPFSAIAQTPLQPQPVIRTPGLANTATANYLDLGSSNFFNTQSNTVTDNVNPLGLFDPGGRITGCDGQPLADYNSYRVSLHDPSPNDPTGAEPGNLVALTPTGLLGNVQGLPEALPPNISNANPYQVAGDGSFSFMLDPQRGQLDVGRTYILVVTPPTNSLYTPRRIRLVIQPFQGSTTPFGDNVPFTITAVDGQPLLYTGGGATGTGRLQVLAANRAGLVLVRLSLDVNVCQAQPLVIVKTGDRAAAEPGDTAIYRLAIRNQSTSDITNLTITDTPPLGFQFIEGSARAELAGTSVPVAATRRGGTIVFEVPVTLPAAISTSQTPVLNIAYAVRITPDGVRGSGINSATVNGIRVDNRRSVQDGPATYRVRVQPGIVSDCGTIIGRVFVDKNFDGEQQPNEPGVPNAVIFLDDGNRVVTDANGVFSVANVIAGRRTGVLDFSSLPGYTLAPNLYFIERNSQSRLVNLQPGGLVRMNFGVTPTFREEKQP